MEGESHTQWTHTVWSIPLTPLVYTEKMLQMGFTLKEIQESLTENRYDEVCATYMLLKRDVKEVRILRVCVFVRLGLQFMSINKASSRKSPKGGAKIGFQKFGGGGAICLIT